MLVAPQRVPGRDAPLGSVLHLRQRPQLLRRTLLQAAPVRLPAATRLRLPVNEAVLASVGREAHDLRSRHGADAPRSPVRTARRYNSGTGSRRSHLPAPAVTP